MIQKLKCQRKMLLIILTSLAIASFSLVLKADDDHESARKLVESGDIVPLEVILMNLQEISAGSVIEVKLERKNNRLVYEIEKINEQGIVYEFSFDAASGRLIREKMED